MAKCNTKIRVEARSLGKARTVTRSSLIRVIAKKEKMNEHQELFRNNSDNSLRNRCISLAISKKVLATWICGSQFVYA